MTRHEFVGEIDAYKQGKIRVGDMSAAVDAYSSALLRQTNCYAALDFLEQELIKEQKAAGNSRFERDYGTHVNKANSISFVIKLIKEHQANAV